jgi:hypothetical protein
MDRRPVGVALVVVALAAVMVLPALPGLRSSGTAVPIALPSPPVVGNCAAAVFPPTADLQENPPVIPVSSVLFGSCRGLIVGEVVAYWPDQQALFGAPRSRRAGPCYQPLVEYAGLQVPGSSAYPVPGSRAEVSWRPTLSFQAYQVTPSDLEQRAGRDWAACVVVAGTGGYYQGSLRDAYADDGLPSVFGSCWNREASGRLTSAKDCADAHSGQLLATGWTADRGLPPADDLSESCRQVAGALMGTGDPTRGGQLAVVADRMDRLTTAYTGNSASIGCFLTTTGDRRLTGLVNGLGDGPIPFVS